MRITILQGAFLPVPPVRGGAVEKLWFQLGKEFALAGHNVLQVSRHFAGLPTSEIIEGVIHIRIRGYDPPRFLILRLLLDLIYSFRSLSLLLKSDVLITNTFWAPFLITFLRPSSGITVVDLERMPKGQLFLYRHSTIIRCCSSAVANRAISQAPYLATRIAVVPNPLPFSRFDLYESNTKKPTILYTGRIHPEKGLALLVSSFNAACQLGLSGWTLRIVGPYSRSEGGGGLPYLRSLQRLASGSSQQIQWIEPIYDENSLQREYLDASIFVYPSLSEHGEAFGLSPLEAMSFGCVPIVSSLECFQDFIIHGYNGLTFDHHSSFAVDIIAQLLLSLARNAAYFEQLSAQALQVRRSHSSQVVANRFCSLFHDFLIKKKALSSSSV